MTAMNKDSAIVARGVGDPSVLEWTEVPAAAPGPGEVLVAHRAVGVNFIDTYFRKGVYPWPSEPHIPGAEAAGVVEAVGGGVNFKVGDRVAYIMNIGAYRTRRVVPADRLVKVPDEIPFEVAASVMLKGMTAQFLVTSCFAVQRGQHVLVHAAAGGVGLLLGQWLSSLGAVAIGTVGSEEKMQIARDNGYAHLVNYRKEDFAARVREITQGAGCDVVYDSVGNDTWRGSLKSLKPRGLFVCFGQSSGVIADFKLADLSAGGSLYCTRPTLFDYIRKREDLEARSSDLFERMRGGKLRAHVGQKVALKDAAEAHRELESRRTTGAMVLIP